MNGRTVSRVLSAALIFQLGIGVLLVLGDIRLAPAGLPGFGPDAPRLTEPVRPGDQRRRFAPDRDLPPTAPAREDGPMPDRLILTQADGGAFLLEGTIGPGDADRIIAQIEEKAGAVESLRLNSPGGSVQDALRLGRFLRNEGIATEVGQGAYCFSACPYILAGGTERRVDVRGSVGVHQHSFGENTLLPAFLAVEDIQRGQSDVMVYLDAMGIDPMVMSHALATPADEIYVLLPEELERYGFVTAID